MSIQWTIVQPQKGMKPRDVGGSRDIIKGEVSEKQKNICTLNLKTCFLLQNLASSIPQ